MRILFLALLGVAMTLAGCASPRATLPRDAAAYSVIPAAPETPPPATVRLLQPGDVIAVDVFREPELGAQKLTIDETGFVQLPLIGQLSAAGLSPMEFSQRVEERLGARYLRNPRVTVALVTAVPRTVTVEGQVKAPGIYPLARNDTLLSSLARAGSPTELAKLNEVVVFRTVNGQRMGAVFDVRTIRVGQAPDPQIIDGDTVVVGFNQVKGAFRDFLSVTPLVNLFTVF